MTESRRKALKTLMGFGSDGATSEEWRKASGLGDSTYHRAVRELQSAKLVRRPGLKSKGERYTLTENGRDAVTVK